MKKIKNTTALAIAALFALTGCTSTATVEEPKKEIQPVKEEPAEKPEAELGKDRNNPAPIGYVIKDGDWEITIDSVNLDATDHIVNEWNDAPEEGNVYIMVEASVTYVGDNPQGEEPWAVIDYVTADGQTIDLAWVGYEETDFTLLDPLYEGATHTGWNAYEVPESRDGVLAVTPDMMSDRTFVAIK